MRSSAAAAPAAAAPDDDDDDDGDSGDAVRKNKQCVVFSSAKGVIVNTAVLFNQKNKKTRFVCQHGLNLLLDVNAQVAKRNVDYRNLL